MGPLGPGGFRRRGRRRGLVVGAAVGSAAARRNNQPADDQAAAAPTDGTNAASQQFVAQNDVNNQMDELKKLAELKDQGILTQEEFDAKKTQILGL